MVSQAQKELVQRSWALVIPDDSDDEQYFAVGKLFFDRIFEVTPSAEGLFSFEGEDRASSAKFREHAVKVIKTVGVAVSVRSGACMHACVHACVLVCGCVGVSA